MCTSGMSGEVPLKVTAKVALKIYRKKNIFGANKPKSIWILKTVGFFG